MMSAGHAGLRRIAARVIGFRRLGAAAEILASLRGNGRDSLQSLWALGRLADAAAYPVLRRVFVEAQNEAVEKTAALALLRGGDQRVVPTCLQQGRRHPSLLLLVGLAGGRDDLRKLLEFSARGDAGPDCLLAMGLLGEISTIGPLIAALNNAATAEAAAVALNLITGAQLYQQPVIAEVLEDDELFDDEPEGDRHSRSTVTRLTRDAAKWTAWWAENTTRFQPTVRYRGGRPYSPLSVLKTLTVERNQQWLRELAYQELVIRYGAETPFETDMLVVEQKRAIVSLEQWATVAEVMYQPGAWYFSGRPLEERRPSSSASTLSEFPPAAGLTSVWRRH